MTRKEIAVLLLLTVLCAVVAAASPQFLSAEAQLASLIAPGVAAFASLPGATCVPAALDLLF